MSVFVLLVLIIIDGSPPRPTTLTAEYTTAEECEAAGVALRAAVQGGRRETIYVCTEGGYE